MKNLVYLISFVILTVSWGCEKNEVPEEQEIVDPNAITSEMLLGDWTFVSLEYMGVIYDYCDVRIKDEHSLSNFDLTIHDNENATLSTDCNIGTDINGTWERNWIYEIINNDIYFIDGVHVFEIISNKNEINNNILKIKYIKSNSKNTPINGIYTLKRK